jgi:ABC-2 type transport system ATP-binding protein
MLKIQNLTKSYSKGNVKAVDNISFEVKPGEIHGFLGPNGAGKTTTIKMIVGLLKQDSGVILVDGIDVNKDSLNAKLRMGYVPDNPQIYDKLKGMEYLNFMADVYNVSKEDRTQRIEKYLKLFSLEDAANDLINSYSHGMKQKLVLTGALLNDPDLFVLDEPMVGLEVAEKICDRISIINNGQIIAQGTMTELRAKAGREESLEKIFLEVTQ